MSRMGNRKRRLSHEPERGCPTRSGFAPAAAREVCEVLIQATRCGWDSRAPKPWFLGREQICKERKAFPEPPPGNP
jgi:hypothetical protein